MGYGRAVPSATMSCARETCSANLDPRKKNENAEFLLILTMDEKLIQFGGAGRVAACQ